jgi:hypothetical protein
MCQSAGPASTCAARSGSRWRADTLSILVMEVVDTAMLIGRGRGRGHAVVHGTAHGHAGHPEHSHH